MTAIRRPYPTRQERMRNSLYHARLHEEAVERATAMRMLLDKGMTYAQVGRVFNTTEGAVKRALHRQGMLK